MFEHNAGIITDEDKLRDRRRVPDHLRKTPALKTIQDIHHQVKRLLFLGMSNIDIANRLNIDKITVKNIKTSPIIQQQLRTMHAAADKEALDLRKRIEEIMPAALDNLKEVIECGTLNGAAVKSSEVLKESNNILDRGIGKPAQTIKASHAHAHFTADDILKLKTRAKSAGGQFDDDKSLITDAEFLDVD